MLIWIVTLVSTGLLAALIVALISNADFRRDVLKGRGEAALGGLIAVKGVVVVLLTALLAGVIVVGLQRVETLQAKADSVDVLDALDVAEAATLDRIFEGRLHLRQKVDEFMRERWYPTYLKKFAQISGILGDLRAADGSEQAELLSDYAATAIEQAASKRDGLLADVDEACDAQEEAIRQLYRARREASLAGGGLRQPKEEKLETDLGNASLRVASALTKLEQIGVPRDSIPWLIVSKLR